MDKIDISVVIPSYNSQKTIGACLEALVGQDGEVGYEVVVVDCSPDGRVEEIVRNFPGAIFIKESKRFNAGTGRNIGAKAARGELLLFLDSDVILQTGGLVKIWGCYKKGYKVFCGALEYMHLKGSTFGGLVKHYFFFHEFQKARRLSERKNLFSTLLVVEKRLFYESGYFDDIFQVEDTVLTEKMRKNNIRLCFIPDVTGRVIHTESLKETCRKVFISSNNICMVNYRNNCAVWKRLLLILVFPALTCAKMIRISARNMIFNGFRGNMIGFFLSPVLFICGFYWMAGFYRGMFLNKEIRTA